MLCSLKNKSFSWIHGTISQCTGRHRDGECAPPQMVEVKVGGRKLKEDKSFCNMVIARTMCSPIPHNSSGDSMWKVNTQKLMEYFWVLGRDWVAVTAWWVVAACLCQLSLCCGAHVARVAAPACSLHYRHWAEGGLDPAGLCPLGCWINKQVSSLLS